MSKETARKITETAVACVGSAAGADELAEFINEHYFEVEARTAKQFDTTSDKYGNSDEYAMYVDGAWLVVEPVELPWVSDAEARARLEAKRK
jgi:hypothetical protein